MQSIGERLEEARKRRGISIREASEATKIRGDFLLNFENNQFDVGLPDIYVRGFLRNYSGFLKIDPEKIVTDFNASLLGEPKTGRRDVRELFGRMEIPERPRPSVDGGAPGGPTAPRRRPEDAPEANLARNASSSSGYSSNRGAGNPELGNYIKIGLIIAAGVAALLVIVWLVMMIISAAQGPARPATSDQPPPSAESPGGGTITLIATGDLWVKVTQANDNRVLFDGQLRAGERKSLARQGAVRIGYNEGAKLQVEVNGRTYGMTSPGMGFSTIPLNPEG